MGCLWREHDAEKRRSRTNPKEQTRGGEACREGTAKEERRPRAAECESEEQKRVLPEQRGLWASFEVKSTVVISAVYS